MTLFAQAAEHRGTQISVVLAVACAGVALGVFSRRVRRPVLVIAAGIGLLFWIAEGFGGIFTGEGTDPNTGPLLIVLAACYWPARPSLRHRRPVSQCAPFGQSFENPYLRTNRPVRAESSSSTRVLYVKGTELPRHCRPGISRRARDFRVNQGGDNRVAAQSVQAPAAVGPDASGRDA